MTISPSDSISVILLFTPSPPVLTFFKAAFKDDHPLLEVEDAEDLLEKVRTIKIKAIILDDKLPIALQETLQKIRNIPTAEKIPILILSSNLKRSYMKELIACGATEFLREPLEKEHVLEALLNAERTQAIQHKVGPLAQSIAQTLPSLAGEAPSKLSKMRISMHDAVLKEIHQALHNKQAVSLLMIDIDHLEKVRIRWGEDPLQELLQKVEEALTRLLRPQDLLVHPSPERFIIVLPKTSETAAKILAENVEEGFANTKFTTQKGSVKLPISIGVVALSNKDMDPANAYAHLEKMLKTGEAYLEKAKKIGKRIVSN